MRRGGWKGSAGGKLTPDDLREVTRALNVRAVEVAREAIGDGVCCVAGDLGPAVGDKLLTGACPEEAVSDSYRDQAFFLKEGGADLLVIETVFDPMESGLAYHAVKDLGLPLLVSVAITRRNQKGEPATDFGLLVEQVPELYPQADILGINCGQDIDLTLEAVGRLSRVTEKPILAKPNAGIPRVVKTKVLYSCVSARSGRVLRALCRGGSKHRRRVLWYHTPAYRRHEGSPDE